ncbi:MAG: phosphodiester glycosidase family protein [Acetobacteraceae bacterium]|nr:MAG: phosphodiester glycosidase family protein [Acetobacteraceae bacterium]
MKLVFALVCFLCTSPLLWAQWTLSERKELPASPGVEFSNVKVANEKGHTAELHVVFFAEKTHTLAVIDNPDGSSNLAEAAKERGALAAVNGGYFHPDRQPLGLVVSGGKTLHGQERAKLLSGVVAASKKGVSLRRMGEFKMSPSVVEALQAGPFLIDGGKAVAGLNASRTAARTVVCNAGAGRVALIICRWATLAETAEILLTPGLFPEGAKITRALNLDGGSSTGMWVRREGEPFYVREFKDVRNYLAVVKR